MGCNPPNSSGGYAIPGPADFKQQFVRDFPYAVPGFGSVIALTVVGGVIASAVPMAGGYNYAPGATVQIAASTGSGAQITAGVSQGQLRTCALVSGGSGYSADVTATLYGGDDSNQKKVTDDDINGAILDANDNMNEDLFPNQQLFTRAFLFLAAHCLVENLMASVEGLASQYSWLTQAKSVGGLSQSFVTSERVREDPFLSLLSTTRYGARYLQIVLPFTVGHTMALPRQTNPV